MTNIEYFDIKKQIQNREEYNIKCCDVLKEIIQCSHHTMRFEQILFNIFYDSKIKENLSYGREPQNSYQLLINYLEKIKTKKEKESKKEIESTYKMENTLIKNCINPNTQCKDCIYNCNCLLSNAITIKPYNGEWLNIKQFDYDTYCSNELKNAKPKTK